MKMVNDPYSDVWFACRGHVSKCPLIHSGSR